MKHPQINQYPFRLQGGVPRPFLLKHSLRYSYLVQDVLNERDVVPYKELEFVLVRSERETLRTSGLLLQGQTVLHLTQTL